jgi:FKBP-type peptidyl-prolyl cis-trans isomerase FkpA
MIPAMKMTIFSLLLLASVYASAADAPKPEAPKTEAAKPAEAKPAEAKPAEAKTAEAKEAKPASPAGLATEDQKTLYTLGYYLGSKLAPFGLTEAELKTVQQGLRDSVLGKKSSVDMNVYGPKINEFAEARERRKTEARKAKEKGAYEKLAAEKGAQKLPSGLIYREITAGTGAQPKAEETVKVHYKGQLVDGTEFDSSYKRGEPTSFPLNQVIKCWTEGVGMIKVGGKAQLVCPSDIAYGDSGSRGIPGGATLIFEVELLDIIKK